MGARNNYVNLIFIEKKYNTSCGPRRAEFENCGPFFDENQIDILMLYLIAWILYAIKYPYIFEDFRSISLLKTDAWGFFLADACELIKTNKVNMEKSVYLGRVIINYWWNCTEIPLGHLMARDITSQYIYMNEQWKRLLFQGLGLRGEFLGSLGFRLRLSRLRVFQFTHGWGTSWRDLPNPYPPQVSTSPFP